MKKNKILPLIMLLILAVALPNQQAMAQPGEYEDGGIYEGEEGQLYRYQADIDDFVPLSESEIAQLQEGGSYQISDSYGSPKANKYVHLKGQRTGSQMGVTKFSVTQQKIPYIEATPYVDTAYKMFDFAGVLSESQIRSIEDRAHLFCDRTGCDIAIVILASCDHPAFEDHSSTESFIMDFYDYNDFKPDGVMLCLDLDHGRNSIFDAGKLYNESFMGGNLEEYGHEMRSLFDSRNYYDEIMWFIEHSEADWLYECSFPVWKCSIFGLLLALIIFFVHKSKYKLVLAGTTANNYKVHDSFVLTSCDTSFVRTFTSKTYSPRNSGGSGGSSGGGHSGGSF